MLLTIREYVPVTVGLAVGSCSVDVNPSGPDQFHAVALLEFAESVTFPPEQIGPPFVGPDDDGTGFTDTTPTLEILESVEAEQVVVHQ